MEYRNGITSCACGEVTLDGVSKHILCKHEGNYLEIDDVGNEIMTQEIILDKKERIKMLDEMIKSYENLPQNAMGTPINHYDFVSALLLLSSILKED